MSKRLDIVNCKDKTPSWHLNQFPNRILTKGQHDHVGEKPTVVTLYTNINRHAGTPSKTKTKKNTMSLDTAQFCYIESRIGWVSAILYYHIIISHRANYSYRLTGRGQGFTFR